MTNHAHIENWPILVLTTEAPRFSMGPGQGGINYPEGAELARFRDHTTALEIMSQTGLGYEVVDTSPKPKIPLGSRTIAWYDADHKRRVAWRYGHAANNVWAVGDEDSRVELSTLLVLIGDSDVKVLEAL